VSELSFLENIFQYTPVQNILEARKKYLFYANKDRFNTIFKIKPLRFLAEAR